MQNQKIIISRNVRFDEGRCWNDIQQNNIPTIITGVEDEQSETRDVEMPTTTPQQGSFSGTLCTPHQSSQASIHSSLQDSKPGKRYRLLSELYSDHMADTCRR